MTDANTSTILTGIKPTGTPHIGNFFGAIEPALRQAKNYEQAFFFIADYHALNSVQDGETMRQHTLNLAATWLASGLDPNAVHFYRQSDISEEFELETILNTVTPKGWMNKMHGYKAAVDRNREAGKTDDNDVNMGLYTYPVLMACDILIFNASVVPVGRDQIQHIEITRDIAQRFNAQYNTSVLTLPEHVINEGIAELPGLDGRKMSKSYNNTIPLFATREQWEQAVRKIVTDSVEHTPETIKETTFMKLYSVIATSEQTTVLTDALVAKSIGWKEAKDAFVDALEVRFGEMSQRYFELIENPEHLNSVLSEGAQKIRPIAQRTLANVKTVIGL